MQGHAARTAQQPNDAFNVLLLHCDAQDGTTSFPDDSFSGDHTVTANADAQIDTAFSKFGGSSALFDGTGDYLSIPDSTDWNITDGDYVVDFWVRHASPGGTEYYCVQYENAGNYWLLQHYASGLRMIHRSNAVTNINHTFGSPITDSNWHHIALVRSGTTYYGFIDGELLDTITEGTTDDFAAELRIGIDGSGTNPLNGSIDEFRICKGTDRGWTQDFNPPAQAYSMAPYDLNYLSGIRVEADVDSEGIAPTGIAFNNDGTKVFTSDNNADSLFEYDLSNPYDLATISAVQVTKDISADNLSPVCLRFNDDGTKIFTAFAGGDLDEYNLSSAFDLSTLSARQVNADISAQDATITGFTFNNDGTKVFVSGSQNDSLYEYNLSSAYDMSTISAVQVTKDISGTETTPKGIEFNDTGTRLFLVGSGGDNIYQFSLTTPYDLNTLSSGADKEAAINLIDNNASGINFNPDGTRLYLTGSQKDALFQMNV